MKKFMYLESLGVICKLKKIEKAGMLEALVALSTSYGFKLWGLNIRQKRRGEAFYIKWLKRGFGVRVTYGISN